MNFSDKAISFFTSLKPDFNFNGVNVINPFEDNNVKSIINKFYTKYFNDNNKRIFIWGINPGRFGGGLTGIPFTDPVALREYCGIENNLGAKRELSSKFIYEMISAYGGVEKFYSRCFFSAVYPLAIIKDNNNYNYYDDKELYISLKDNIISFMKSQVAFGAEKSLSVCLGMKNYKYLKEINDELNFFEKIIVVEHPRYIMQYKSKSIKSYIDKYLEALS